MSTKHLLLASSLALLTVTASARPPADSSGVYASWFESLTQPGTGLSCCGEADGHIMAYDDVRQTKDGYEVRIGSRFVPIPPEVLLQRVDNPTGAWVVFWIGDNDDARVLCAIRPAEV